MNKTTEALKLAEEALNAMLTHMGMDEDEWTKPTFNQAREALAAIREALADHSGDANEMVMDWSKVKPEAINSDPMYQMGYAAAKAEPVKQEPVAWRVHPFDYGVGHEGAYAMTMRLEQVEAWNRKGWIVEPLYAAPVSAEAIRSEALEEAAKVCRTAQAKGLQSIREAIEAAIRGLK